MFLTLSNTSLIFILYIFINQPILDQRWLLIIGCWIITTQLHRHQELLLRLYEFDFKFCLILSDRDQIEAVNLLFSSFLSEYITLIKRI